MNNYPFFVHQSSATEKRHYILKSELMFKRISFQVFIDSTVYYILKILVNNKDVDLCIIYSFIRDSKEFLIFIGESQF